MKQPSPKAKGNLLIENVPHKGQKGTRAKGKLGGMVEWWNGGMVLKKVLHVKVKFTHSPYCLLLTAYCLLLTRR